MNKLARLPFVGILGLIFIAASGCSFFGDSAETKIDLEHFALAANNYRDTFKKYPPVFITDEAGNALHSWRVMLLPFIEANDFWEQYDFRSAWDSAENEDLADGSRQNVGDKFEVPSRVGEVYLGGRRHKTWHTKLVLLVNGPLRLAPFWDESQFRDLTGHYVPTAQSFVILELKETDIHWMEPRDVTIDGVVNPGWPRLADWKDRIVRSAELVAGETTIRDRDDTLEFLETRFGGSF